MQWLCLSLGPPSKRYRTVAYRGRGGKLSCVYPVGTRTMAPKAHKRRVLEGLLSSKRCHTFQIWGACNDDLGASSHIDAGMAQGFKDSVIPWELVDATHDVGHHLGDHQTMELAVVYAKSTLIRLLAINKYSKVTYVQEDWKQNVKVNQSLILFDWRDCFKIMIAKQTWYWYVANLLCAHYHCSLQEVWVKRVPKTVITHLCLVHIV